jgi:hypothetical protein
MNKRKKAALLSAFVFPGIGHFFLKKYVTGAVLAATALAGLYYLIARAVEKALQLSAGIQSGEVRPDAATITELVSNDATGAEALLLNIATAAVIISWLVGIADSYRIGRARDKVVDDVE